MLAGALAIALAAPQATAAVAAHARRARPATRGAERAVGRRERPRPAARRRRGPAAGPPRSRRCRRLRQLDQRSAMLDGDDGRHPAPLGAGPAGSLRRGLRHRRWPVPRRRQADPRLLDRWLHRPRRPGGGRGARLRRPGRDEPRRGPGRRVRGHRHHRGGRGPRRRGQRGEGAALGAGRHGQDPPGRAPTRSPPPARVAGSTTPPSCTPPTPWASDRSGSSRSPTARTSGSGCSSAPTAARSPCTSTTPRDQPRGL